MNRRGPQKKKGDVEEKRVVKKRRKGPWVGQSEAKAPALCVCVYYFMVFL